MYTLKLHLDDDIYETLKAKSIDIPTKINEYLANLADDGYPAISREEAKKKVTDAVSRYKRNTGVYATLNEYNTHKDSIISNLKSKYANK